jgi:predicted MFS family arabinose efflux permease
MKSSKSLKKWFMVSLFGLSAATSQALWLNFGPLLSLIEKKFSVTEDQAGLLLLVFPLIYVLISIPSGRFIDKKGYRKSLLIGGFVMAVFSSIRIFAFSFWILLIAQAGIAVAQPFIINSISKLVLDWFPKNEEAVATGVGTGGMFIGMAAGLMATPYFVEKVGFENTMILFALISVLSLALSYFFIHPPNTEYKIMSPIEDSKQIETISLRSILKDRNLALIFLVSFLGLGFFNGLTNRFLLHAGLTPFKLASWAVCSSSAGLLDLLSFRHFLIFGSVVNPFCWVVL